jgi:hypothetical protein
MYHVQRAARFFLCLLHFTLLFQIWIMTALHISREARRFQGTTVSTSLLHEPPASARRATR